jgi:hypothetical protein
MRLGALRANIHSMTSDSALTLDAVNEHVIVDTLIIED